jgi:hypothetical protein
MMRRSVLWIAILTLILTGCSSKVERLPALSSPPVFATLPEPDPHMPSSLIRYLRCGTTSFSVK